MSSYQLHTSQNDNIMEPPVIVSESGVDCFYAEHQVTIVSAPGLFPIALGIAVERGNVVDDFTKTLSPDLILFDLQPAEIAETVAAAAKIGYQRILVSCSACTSEHIAAIRQVGAAPALLMSYPDLLDFVVLRGVVAAIVLDKILLEDADFIAGIDDDPSIRIAEILDNVRSFELIEAASATGRIKNAVNEAAYARARMILSRGCDFDGVYTVNTDPSAVEAASSIHPKLLTYMLRRDDNKWMWDITAIFANDSAAAFLSGRTSGEITGDSRRARVITADVKQLLPWLQ